MYFNITQDSHLSFPDIEMTPVEELEFPLIEMTPACPYVYMETEELESSGNTQQSALHPFTMLFKNSLQHTKKYLLTKNIYSEDDIQSICGNSYSAMIQHAILHLAETLRFENQDPLILQNRVSDRTPEEQLYIQFYTINKAIQSLDALQLDELSIALNHKKDTSDFSDKATKQAFQTIVATQHIIDRHIMNSYGKNDEIAWHAIFVE